MDKIREHIFLIGVGAGGLGFLALLYFLVIDPLMTLAGEGEESVKIKLDSNNRSLKNFADKSKTPQLPSKELHGSMETTQKNLDAALKEAVEYCEKHIAEPFNSFPEAFAADKDNAAAFNAKYTTEIARLKTEYMTAFPRAGAAAAQPGAALPGTGQPGAGQPGVAPPADDGTATPAPEAAPKPPEAPVAPAVEGGKKDKDADIFDIAQMEVNSDVDIPRAMKEYLIIHKVFQSATKLKLGGLQEIDFPKAASKDTLVPNPLYKVFDSKVVIDLPMASLEPLLAELLDLSPPADGQGGQVPLLFKSVSVHRKADTLQKSRLLQKDYDSLEAAQKDNLLPPEPPVRAEILLWAVEWQGLPKEAPAKPEPSKGPTKKGTPTSENQEEKKPK